MLALLKKLIEKIPLSWLIIRFDVHSEAKNIVFSCSWKVKRMESLKKLNKIKMTVIIDEQEVSKKQVRWYQIIQLSKDGNDKNISGRSNNQD